MRRAVILAALPLLAGLASCGDKGTTNGPERRSAAGEVLGGEVSDDMLPLDTARSTSPAAPRVAASGAGTASGSAEDEGTAPPSPDISGATPVPQAVETLPAGPPPPQ